jgi:hypothetical protein
MLIHLFTTVFFLLSANPQPQNYFPDYASAREASRKDQKDLLVFFSGPSCSSCQAAWSAFIHDGAATQRYISTSLDARDFDGGVFFEYFEFKQAPAWVILSPDASVKEKWEGGWKDVNGNAVLFDQNMLMIKDEELRNETPVHSESTVEKNVYKESVQKKIPVAAESIPPASKNELAKSGYILQAGYFGSEMNAKKMMAELKSKGFADFKMETVQKNGSTFYRIISSTYSSESGVYTAQEQLTSAGVKSSVINQ